MSLQARLDALITVIGTDIKQLQQDRALKKNNSALSLNSTSDILGSYTVQDDGTPTASWPDRLQLYYRNAAGTVNVLVLKLNEYFEFRLTPAKIDTTPFRIFSRNSSSSAAHSNSSPLIEIQDNPDTGGQIFAVFPSGLIKGLNIDAKVVVVANGESAGSQPDGTVVIELSA